MYLCVSCLPESNTISGGMSWYKSNRYLTPGRKHQAKDNVWQWESESSASPWDSFAPQIHHDDISDCGATMSLCWRAALRKLHWHGGHWDWWRSSQGVILLQVHWASEQVQLDSAEWIPEGWACLISHPLTQWSTKSTCQTFQWNCCWNGPVTFAIRERL